MKTNQVTKNARRSRLQGKGPQSLLSILGNPSETIGKINPSLLDSGNDGGHRAGTGKAPPVLTGQPVGCATDSLTACLKDAQFPARYLTARLRGFDVDDDIRRQAMVTVKRWLNSQNNGRWLYLFGDVGTGKTYLAHAIVAELAAGGHQKSGVILSVDWVSMCLELKSRANYGLNAEQTLKAINTAGCLIIDDFGKAMTSWNLELGFMVLNGRYNRRQMTIITSNARPESLKKRDCPGPAIFDRIKEMALGINLGDQSRRGRGKR